MKESDWYLKQRRKEDEEGGPTTFGLDVDTSMRKRCGVHTEIAKSYFEVMLAAA